MIKSEDAFREGSFTLRFPDPEVEDSFRQEVCRRGLWTFRGILVVTALCIIGFDITDIRYAPQELETLRSIRFGYMVPVVCLMALGTLWSGYWRAMQGAAAASLILVSAGLLMLLAVFPDTLPASLFNSIHGAEPLGIQDEKFIFFLTVVSLYLMGSVASGLVRFVTSAVVAIAFLCLAGLSASLFHPSPIALLFVSMVAPISFLISVYGAYRLEAYLRRDFATSWLLEREKDRSQSLLLNILPEPIANRLMAGSDVLVEGIPDASVLFADLVGFTGLSARLPPAALVGFLNTIFSGFDALADSLGLEKIKTIGDAYMVASGVPVYREDHIEALAEMALGMMDLLADIEAPGGGRVEMRIGMHSGPLVAGVIGTRKIAYDLWGDTVNTASRMESHGEMGRIHVSERVYGALSQGFELERRGQVTVKGKGEMTTWWLLGRKPKDDPGAEA